jgi:TolB protein
MNADGTDQRRLTNTPDDELNPVWSLDGKQIAFMSEREHPLMSGALDIFAAGAAGGEAHKITKDTVFEGGAVWSPDGNSAAYMSNKEGEWNIYRMKADGSSVRRLTDSSADDLFPIWRP